MGSWSEVGRNEEHCALRETIARGYGEAELSPTTLHEGGARQHATYVDQWHARVYLLNVLVPVKVTYTVDQERKTSVASFM